MDGAVGLSGLREAVGAWAAACTTVQPLSAGLPGRGLDQPGCSADEGPLLSPSVCPACVGKASTEMNSPFCDSFLQSCACQFIDDIKKQHLSYHFSLFPNQFR